SFSRVCLDIKSFIGTLAFLYASSKVISSSNKGSNASLYTSEKVGAITKKVKNKAKPINTWFGGICCVAKDVLTKDKTTIIRIKLVAKINIPGAIDKIVNNKSNLTDVVTLDGSELEKTLINSSIRIIIFLIHFH